MSHTPDGSAPVGIHSSVPNTGSTGLGHAVVIGGSMAGLLAARVLADHFEQVTLVERDALPDSVQARKGVPQGRMLHALMARGQEIVERLFPGYGDELKASGAVAAHMPTDAVILTPVGWLDRRATGWPLLSASRPLFEWAVRRRLRELPGVTILDRHDVTSLLTSRDGRQVTGVTLRSLDDPAGTHQQLAAELVVDASGRDSRTPTWLAEGGTANRQWHYERMCRWPQRFVVLGDAVCANAAPPARPLETAANLHKRSGPAHQLPQ